MTDAPVVRSELGRLRAEIAAFTESQAEAFRAGAPVSDLLAARAKAFDGWLSTLWRDAMGGQPGAALFAVGGYGRGELHPQSDLDLAILIASDSSATTLANIEGFVSGLWDLGLRPGHSVRTAAQTTEAAQDIAVCTNLIEARLLVGKAEDERVLANAVAPDKVWPAVAFVEAKLAEAAARHARFGDTSYNLEPNLKEGPGGLRDLQTIAWIARRVTGSADPGEWSKAGVIGPRGYAQFQRSLEELQRLRFGLHTLAGRAEERLLFDYQPALAQLFGFEDLHRENRAVEQMMQGFFRAALGVRRIYTRVAERWRERNGPAVETVALDDEFVRCGNRLSLADPQHLRRSPGAIIRLFACWQRNPELAALTIVTGAALEQALIEQEAEGPLSATPEARSAFLEILAGARVAETLSRMHLYGVLGAYLPAFAKVTGRMQYDLFHVYTVDQHTLRVIGNLDRFAADDAPEFPRAASVFADLRKPVLLYLAALFHDIAKGRGGDHSELGADDALVFCREHGLSAGDTDLVAWLVRNHLMLSVVAQKSDITDPTVINRFAADVADRDRLDNLYLLTMADIAGTAPTLWNTWKARLIAELYTAARFALRRGLEHPIHADERISECRQAALTLLSEAGIDEATARDIWADFPPPSFLRYRAGQIAWLTGCVAGVDPDALPLVAVRSESSRGAREIFVHGPDLDGLFAAITAALDRLDLDVVEAHILTSRKGFSLDTFRVLERHPHGPGRERDEEIERSLRYALNQRPLRVGPVRRSLSRTQRHFQMTPRIDFTTLEASARTRMALVCSDRPGLLALIAQLLREQRIRIHGARIATFGERAEDFFTLSDENNRPLDDETCQRLGAHLRDGLGRAFGNGA